MNVERLSIVLAALVGGALLATHAAAQTMYRCGSAYQDRPCAAGQSGQAVGRTTTTAASAPTSDGECRQRGADAQKMSWAREAGQTLEQQQERIDRGQSSASRKAYERELALQVYARRGSSAQVRAAIEADCVAEKQKAAETAAAAKALGLQPAAPQTVPSAAPVGPSAEDRRAAEERARQSASAREAQRRQERCQSLNAQLDGVRSRQRAGGSAATMDSLSQQRRDIEGKLAAGGC